MLWRDIHAKNLQYVLVESAKPFFVVMARNVHQCFFLQYFFQPLFPNKNGTIRKEKTNKTFKNIFLSSLNYLRNFFTWNSWTTSRNVFCRIAGKTVVSNQTKVEKSLFSNFWLIFFLLWKVFFHFLVFSCQNVRVSLVIFSIL